MDKKLFDQIKSTLEGYEPDYNPQSWDRFSKILDEKQAKPKPFSWTNWLNGFFSGILIAFLFVGSYFLCIKPERDPLKAQTKIESNFQPAKQACNPNQLGQKRSAIAETVIRDEQINRKPEMVEEKINDLTVSKEPDRMISDPEIVESDERLVQETYLIKPNYQIRFVFNSKLIAQDLPSSFYGSKNRLEKKKKKSNSLNIKWNFPSLSGNFQSDMYKNFIGPDRVKVGFEPGLMFGDFQDKSGFNYTGSFTLQGPIASNILVGIGVQYSNYSWKKENVFGKYVQMAAPDTSLQFVVDSIHINKGEWNYFEIPLSLSLNIVSIKKSSFYLNTSLAAVLMRKEKYQFDRIIGQNKFTTYNEPKKWANYNLLGSFRIGLEYRYVINERWSLWAEPYYKHYLNGIGENNFKPRNFGLGFGVVYQFNLHK